MWTKVRDEETTSAVRGQRAIRVLLPPIELIVDGERDTLLESTLRVCGPSNDVSLELRTKCQSVAFMSDNHR